MVNGEITASRPLRGSKEISAKYLWLRPGPPTGFPGEGIHPGNSIEWWFVHGSFQGATLTPRYFMISIFRYDLTPEKNASDNGYYVILSLLDPATGKNDIVSRGERRVIGQIFTQGNDVESTNIDRDLVTTYIDEVTAYRPPVPVTLADDLPHVGQEPFSFTWDDIDLQTEGDSLVLTLDIPGSSRCRLCLEPRSARHCLGRIGTTPARSMNYLTCPGLNLSGYFGNEPVTGTAWYDHQWGNSGWFLSQPGRGDLHGWDWAGISGSDGTFWIFLTFRNPEDNGILGQSAFRFGNGGEETVYREFHVHPLRFWTSPKTRIRYPVAQEISVPEAGARFVIEPVADDQEIPLLGFMRAVWEGAATCSGSVGELPFTGTARLELHGYGYIFDFRHYLDAHIDRIRKTLTPLSP